MSWCKYHPLAAATQHCPSCNTNLCATCCDEDTERSDIRCLFCNAKTSSLGITADTEPFWRHLDASFRYPMTKPVMGFVAIVSLLSVCISWLPWPFMIGLYLLLTGVMVKYCFNCLTETAGGKMKAPDFTSAYEGGVLLVLKLFGAIVIMIAAVVTLAIKVSPTLAGFVGFFLILALPAMIILYAMTEDMGEALSPLRMIGLMRTIGLPYLIILGILLIMISSVEVLHELLWSYESLVALTLQSIISNYYSIVMFHLLGYMIFQYQHELGYIAAKDSGEKRKARPPHEKCLARCQILVKEGQFENAQALYRRALKEFPNNNALNEYYFQFTLGLLPSTLASATDVVDRYLNYLIRTKQHDKLYPSLKRARLALPDYLPGQVVLRHELAQASYNNGDPIYSVKLLTNLHKNYPDYPELAPAYQLLARAMDDIPGMEVTAEKCRQFVEQMKLQIKQIKQKALQAQVEQAASHAVTEAEEPSVPMSNAASPLSLVPIAIDTHPAQDNKKNQGDSKNLPPIEFR